jgi:purine-binding chemotaxis protein CheW
MTYTESRFLIFALDEEKYALPLQDVEEIVEFQDIYPLPIAPSYYSGVMNWHGTPVPILDLAAFYKKASLNDGKKVLVLDRKIANLALRVHSVFEIVSGMLDSAPGAGGIDGVENSVVVCGSKIAVLEIEKLLLLLEEGVNSR